MFDEIHAYYAPKLLGKGKTIFNGKKGISELLNLSIVDTEIFENDIKITYKRD
jgi:riboflavin biosynthesis pyrimidine reductase